MYRLALIVLVLLVSGCERDAPEPEASIPMTPETPAPDQNADVGSQPPVADERSARRPLFGDLHVHTYYSFDAFLFGTRTTPDAAYEYARSEAIEHPAGFSVQLRTPSPKRSATRRP